MHPQDGLGHGAEIVDGGEQVGEAGTAIGQFHAIAIHRPGDAEGFGDLQQLLGSKCRADGRTPYRQADIVQAAEGWTEAL